MLCYRRGQHDAEKQRENVCEAPETEELKSDQSIQICVRRLHIYMSI